MPFENWGGKGKNTGVRRGKATYFLKLREEKTLLPFFSTLSSAEEKEKKEEASCSKGKCTKRKNTR